MSRSKFLTYWSGKDIATDTSALTVELRQRYVSRLVDIIENGFWMTVPKETVTGWSARSHGSFIRYETAMTCFTELRLSSARTHTKRYGLLGIVVERQFILDRYGGPVMYVRSDPREAVVGNLKEILQWLERPLVADMPESSQVRKNLLHAIAFLKSMSDPETDNFAYIDENEWRVILADNLVKKGFIVATESLSPPYRLPIRAPELRMLVVPDAVCRTLITGNVTYQKYLGGSQVPILTIDEATEL